VRLAAGARLTPLAQDYVKERGLTVERASGTTNQRVNESTTSPWLWWLEGQCPAVGQITGELRSRLVPATHGRSADALKGVVRDLAQQVKAGRVAGGLLFVSSAARAICYANRCPSLRAVVATCGEAVEEGIDRLGANVLVVEYPHHGPRAMRAMVERFTDAARPAPPNVAGDLQELSTCG
jgi:hypothetical protein